MVLGFEIADDVPISGIAAVAGEAHDTDLKN
jgi:hypothetical protein